MKNGNLRSAPSTTAKIIGKVTVRQEVTQVGKSGEWYKIKLPGGQVGWAHQMLISAKPAVKKGTTVKSEIATAISEGASVRKIDASDLGPVAPDNFSAKSGIMNYLSKVSAGTHCLIKGDSTSTIWYLVLYSGDKLEYSKSKSGPGKPTGNVIYFDNAGGLDPAVGAVYDDKGNTIIPKGKNLISQPHQSGATYSIWKKTMPGEYGPMAPEHLPNFLGIGTAVRFPPDTWILFGDKQYRNGGFIITQLSVEFLPRTEVKYDLGTFIFYDRQWRRLKSR
ncbi:MAG: SH3 domain-containing protein [Bacteroidales bacterium]|nr:SH3 domain-containing protein [Bacteroidales bacterium]